MRTNPDWTFALVHRRHFQSFKLDSLKVGRVATSVERTAPWPYSRILVMPLITDTLGHVHLDDKHGYYYCETIK